MAKLLQHVGDVDVGHVLVYWRKFLEADLPGLHARTLICARVCRQMWEAHDAWISLSQPKVAHEAQPQLLAINKEHQKLGVRLAKAELVLDTTTDVSAVWMSAALPLAFLPGSIVVGLTSIGNQLRWLTTAPDVVIEVNGTMITLATMATAAGTTAWWDTAAQATAETLEPVGEVVSKAISGSLETAGAALEAVKGVVKGAAQLIKAGPGLATLGIALGVIYVIKR